MRRLAVFALALWGTSAVANPVSVRSGDHAEFTRLVFGITPGTSWQIGRIENGYGLRLGEGRDFDLSRAFDRITRDRVADLVPEGRLMKIALGCDCHAQAELFRDDMLIIDIRDGPAAPGSALEQALAAEDLELPGPQTANRVTLGSGLMPDPLGTAVNTGERVGAAEDAVLESLARAASQGILEFDGRQTDLDLTPAVSPVSETNGVPEETEEAVSRPADLAALFAPRPAPARPLSEPSPGIHAQTSMERDTAGAPGTALSASGELCLEASATTLADWATGDDFPTAIAAGLAALTDENGDLDTRGILDLAKTYVYFGFGKEALAVLRLDGARSVERDTLAAIAAALEGEHEERPLLADQLGCVGPVALWSALARDSVVGTGEVEQIAILAAHEALPNPIRDFIGPRLAQLFLDAGEPETAEAILEKRPDDPPQDDSILATVHVTEAVEGPVAALEELEASLDQSQRPDPAATIKLLELSVAEGEPIEDGLIDLAVALRFEQRGTTEEASLTAATAEAMISNRRFGEAITFVAEGSDAVPDDMKEDLTTRTIVALSAEMGDGEFLEAAFGGLPLRISAEAENAVAARLTSLGFTSEAAALLTGSAEGSAMAQRRYLRAEVAAAEGRLAESREILTGMPTALAQVISEQDQADPPSGADLETAWRESDWRSLEASEDPALRDAARAMLASDADAFPLENLTQRQLLVDEAEATRNLAEELLARFPVVPPGPALPAP